MRIISNTTASAVQSSRSSGGEGQLHKRAYLPEDNFTTDPAVDNFASDETAQLTITRSSPACRRVPGVCHKAVTLKCKLDRLQVGLGKTRGLGRLYTDTRICGVITYDD